MEPTIDDLSLRKIIYMFFVQMGSENCTFNEDRSDWLTDKNNLTSRAS